MISDATLDLLEGAPEGEEDEEARIKREFKNSEILRMRFLKEAKKARLFLDDERTSDDIFHRYYKLHLGQFEWENDQIELDEEGYTIPKEDENLKAGY